MFDTLSGIGGRAICSPRLASENYYNIYNVTAKRPKLNAG
jgi:hypothetical protein